MKTFAVLCALAISAPVFACPNSDHSEAPKTADKKPDAKPAEAPKAEQKPADTAKAPAATPKKPDKVSSR